MRQLSGMDNVFLHMEHGNQYMHVAGLGIYDPSTAPGGAVRFKDILQFFSARIETVPIFRRRLVRVPNDLDRPYWIEEADIDVEFHVRHIALPQPGDWRQLCIQVARIHSRPLDRSKPLWEAYVIEGLDNIPDLPPGSFALYIKFHHSAVDGEAGTEILKAIHALTPELEDGGSLLPRAYADREPNSVELYSRTLVNYAQRLPSLARFSFGVGARAVRLGLDLLGQVSRGERPAPAAAADLGLDALVQRPPATRFAKPVSAHRVVEAVGFPLATLKAMRHAMGQVTINDLFMAIVGGALNRYLGSKGELPDRPLTAMVPMAIRGPESGVDAGNQIGFAIMPVHSQITDPLTRLKTIRDDAQKAKRLAGRLGKDLAKQIYDQLPPAASEFVTRHMVVPQMSMVVSNVRGPEVPLYLGGARLVNFAPISIVVDGLGLNTTAFSYNGVMWICAVACREMMPDPGFFADCLRESFAGLVAGLGVEEAAGETARAAAVPAPSGKRAAKLAASRKKPRPGKRRVKSGKAGAGQTGGNGSKAPRAAR